MSPLFSLSLGSSHLMGGLIPQSSLDIESWFPWTKWYVSEILLELAPEGRAARHISGLWPLGTK